MRGASPSRSPAEGSIGRALARLPHIDAAFRDGVLSYSKVRAITRVATRESEAVLLDIAGGSSAAQLESLVRTHERIGADERERVRSEERRSLNWYYEDGMVVITAAVPAERGALVIQALKKVVDARKDEREAYYEALLEGELRHGSAAAEEEPHGPGDVSAETESPVADACEHEPLGATGDRLPAGLEFGLSSTEQRHADALVEVAEHYLANGPGKRGRRYEVVLTIGRNELAGQRTANGLCYHVDRDWGIDEEDARRIACDADITEFIQDAKGNLLNYERRQRIVPARLLRALKLRDHNRCRFPGCCAHQRYVEAHHVEHWIDGGETRLDNLVLLCSAHHRLLHHGAFRIVVEEDGLTFVSRDGEVDRAGAAAAVPGNASDGVSGETRRAGPPPPPWTVSVLGRGPRKWSAPGSPADDARCAPPALEAGGRRAEHRPRFGQGDLAGARHAAAWAGDRGRRRVARWSEELSRTPASLMRYRTTVGVHPVFLGLVFVSLGMANIWRLGSWPMVALGVALLCVFGWVLLGTRYGSSTAFSLFVWVLRRIALGEITSVHRPCNAGRCWDSARTSSASSMARTWRSTSRPRTEASSGRSTRERRRDRPDRAHDRLTRFPYPPDRPRRPP